MGVDTGVTGRSSEVLVFSVGNMFAVPLYVPLCKSEINDVYFMFVLSVADQEVVRLDVSMQEISGVDVLYPGYHLVRQH